APTRAACSRRTRGTKPRQRAPSASTVARSTGCSRRNGTWPCGRHESGRPGPLRTSRVAGRVASAAPGASSSLRRGRKRSDAPRPAGHEGEGAGRPPPGLPLRPRTAAAYSRRRGELVARGDQRVGAVEPVARDVAPERQTPVLAERLVEPLDAAVLHDTPLV